MAAALRASTLHVDYLFSGRPPGRYFDMECFGDYRTRRGLSFVNVAGRVRYLRTLLANDYLRFLRDVASLDVAAYDLILTDFEPITAWAGRMKGTRVVSIGHQPAFDHAVPVANRDLRSEWVMRLFAPGDIRVGMHWDKFGAPILPPMIDVGSDPVHVTEGKVLVYLPFEDPATVCALLHRLPAYEFFVYAPGATARRWGNLHLRPTSLSGFRADLHDCAAVICNAGFELASECLALGKRLLVKPQGGQMEQASNALALRQLGYGAALEALDPERIGRWLDCTEAAPRFRYPDVAAAVVAWLEAGDLGAASLARLSESLWQSVQVLSGPHRAVVSSAAVRSVNSPPKPLPAVG